MVGEYVLYKCDGRFGINDNVTVKKSGNNRGERNKWESPNPETIPNSIPAFNHLNKTILIFVHNFFIQRVN